MPTLSEFDHAMHDPGRFVPAVRRLGGGTLAITASGDLWRIVGRTAVVYALRCPTGRILALRVPRERHVRQIERYTALASAPGLAPLRVAGGPLPNELRTIADGITLPAADFRSVSHPLVAMEYIPGGTLAQGVTEAIATDDRAAIGGLADAWRAAAAEMEAHGFSHGDLRPGNVVLRPEGALAVVDFDTAVWPGSPPLPGVLEPARRDRLPALLLYVELLGLAWRPELRTAQTPEERLLFQSRDLHDPVGSDVLRTLRAASDPTLATAARVLTDALQTGPAGAPSFREALASIAAGTTGPLPTWDATVAPAFNEGGTPRDGGWGAAPAASADAGQIERRRAVGAAREAAQADDLDRLLRIWDEAGLADDLAAADLRPRVEAAREAAGLFERLRAALDGGDPDLVGRLWFEARHDPRAGLLAPRVDTLLSRDLLARIERARRREDERSLAALVQEADRARIAVRPDLRRAARTAAQRTAVRERMERALETNDRGALADLSRTGELAALGRPDARLRHAAERALAWSHLERALAVDDDVAILSAYDPDLFAGDPNLSLEQTARIDLATARTAWLHAARVALRRRDGAAARTALAGAPPGIDRRLSAVERTRLARLAGVADAHEQLERALRAGADADILAALAALEAAGAPLPRGADWQAIRAAADRDALARAVTEAAAATPPDYQRLARLLPSARLAFDADEAAALDLDRLEWETLRTAHLERLREAIAANDDIAIAAAARPDPYGAVAALGPAARGRIAAALARVG
ncbi:MAG: phosphotransferase [Thermomicrobiales bacterium]|nr:phosphotransferase [Thermomicrobiales bacterium]